MALFILLITGAAAAFAFGLGFGWEIIPFALIISGLIALISYRFSDSVVLAVSQAHEVKEDENPELYHIVENLCIGDGLPMPKVYIIDDTAPNAFATGRDPKHATVVVTKGLLQKLDKLELEGVIGHELSHVKNYDIRLMAVVAGLGGVGAFVGGWVFRFSVSPGMERE